TAPFLSAASEGQLTDKVCGRNAQEQRVHHGSVRDFPQPPSQCANDAHQEADYPQCSRQQSSRQEDTGEQDCPMRVDLRQASCQQEANEYGFWQHALYKHDLQRLQQLVVRTPESLSLSAINAKRAHNLAAVLIMDNPDPSLSASNVLPRRIGQPFQRIPLIEALRNTRAGITSSSFALAFTSTINPNASPSKFISSDCACHKLVGPPSFPDHWSQVHARYAYYEPNFPLKDDVCGYGRPDSVTFLRHVSGSDPSSPQRVETLLHQYDPLSFIVYQHTNDILRSSVLCPEPEVHYDMQALEGLLITQQDLQILWIQQLARLSGTSISHPDATLSDRDGSIITTTVVLLTIPNFAPHMVIPDPYKNLTPSTFGPARPSIIPTRAKLRRTCTAAIAQPKIHLNFIERHDEDAYKYHFESHLNSAILTATELHLSGRASVQSITVVCSEHLPSCFLPSFAHDLDVECQLVSRCLAGGQRSASTLEKTQTQPWRQPFGSSPRSSIQIMQGLCPVLVAMGVNAMYQDWERLCLYMYKFNIEYGPLDVWLRISQEEAEEMGRDTSMVLCPVPLVNGLIGFYTSTDIVEHESQIKSDGGVQIWRGRIGGRYY
ncbi:hypothetical protein KCU78_g7955, partial [Aureobasidium melanogenum]